VADGYDLQFNLTIPHRLMEETVERWFGFVPDDKLWAHRCVFAENGSSWLALLDYATRSIDARVNAVPNPLTEKRIQETICLDLLQFWCASADIDLTTGARAAAPRYVRDAEKLMDEAAGSGTSVLAVADALGITARSLSEGFRRFRGITPYSYLKTRRLEALHDRLMVASVFDTVTSIAKEMGFVNLGALSASYRERFGETPAQTLHHNNRRRM
jgi:AraC-like DNA-binding protein